MFRLRLDRSAVGLAVSGLLLVLIFVAFPQLDLLVSGWFFAPQQQRFVWQQFPWVGELSQLVRLSGWCLGVGLLLAMGFGWWRNRQHHKLPRSFYRHLYVLLALLLGAGLLVNSVVKPTVGRARPYTVAEFGGSQRFTAPWVISDQCQRNCSFPSGDAAMGFFWLVPAVVYRPKSNRRRAAWILLALVVAIGCSLPRLGAGKHFLSDLVWSAWLVLAASCLLHRLLKRLWRR